MDRIVFGTDYPFGPGKGRTFVEKAVACVEGLPVGPQEKAKVYGGTAWGLLERRERHAGHGMAPPPRGNTLGCRRQMSRTTCSPEGQGEFPGRKASEE